MAAPQGDEIIEQLKRLPEYALLVASPEPQAIIDGTVGLRKVLSIEQNPPIDAVISSKAIPHLVRFLKHPINPRHQFEAAWALTNIASGTCEQTLVLVQSGAVPEFVRLIDCEDEQVREQAIWALGNIAGDSSNCRDYVLQFNIIDKLLAMTQDGVKNTIQRNAIWTISNLCRGKPAPPFNQVRVCLPDLTRLLYSSDDQILIDTLWALSYLSDGDNVKIQAVMEADISRRVVELLMHHSPGVQTPALRVVGNIVTGDDIQTQTIINVSALPRLKNLLISSSKRGIRKEVCWTLSNITAGTAVQIQAVIEADLIPCLIEQLKSGEFDIKKEAAWAIANATSSGTADQVNYLVKAGCIPPLCDLLTVVDARIIAVALEGLENILDFGENSKILDPTGNTVNKYAEIVEEVEGLEKIEELQEHPNPLLYDKALKIIERFFGVADEDQNTVPNINEQQNSFAFTPNKPEVGFNWN